MERHSLRRLALAALCAGAGTAHAAKTCEQFGVEQVEGGKAYVQNNFFNPTNGTMCISTTEKNGNFKVTNTNVAATNGAPSGYPSIVVGCHWGNCSTGSALPLQVSAVSTAPSKWTVVTPTSGAWDAAYDIWFNKAPTTDGQPDGTEIMVWLNHGGGVQPAGTKTGTATINGMGWDVWTAPVGSAGFNTIWNIVSYVAQSPTAHVDFDLKPFFDDSVSRQMLSSSWYLIDVEAGFELWSGPSATSKGFKVNFNKGSGGGGGGIDPSAWYTVQSVGNGGCLEDYASGTANGTPVYQDACAAGSDIQQWQFTPTDGGFYKVASRHASGLALDSGGSADGALQQLWSYGGGTNQQWMPTLASDGSYTLVGRQSGLCLDVPQGTSGAVRVQIWDCWGGANQAFKLVKQ